MVSFYIIIIFSSTYSYEKTRIFIDLIDSKGKNVTRPICFNQKIIRIVPTCLELEEKECFNASLWFDRSNWPRIMVARVPSYTRDAFVVSRQYDEKNLDQFSFRLIVRERVFVVVRELAALIDVGNGGIGRMPKYVPYGCGNGRKRVREWEGFSSSM